MKESLTNVCRLELDQCAPAVALPLFLPLFLAQSQNRSDPHSASLSPYIRSREQIGFSSSQPCLPPKVATFLYGRWPTSVDNAKLMCFLAEPSVPRFIPFFPVQMKAAYFKMSYSFISPHLIHWISSFQIPLPDSSQCLLKHI